MSQTEVGALLAQIWSHVSADNPKALQVALSEMKQPCRWRTLANSIPTGLTVPSRLKEIFHTHWTERGEYIRRDIGNDRTTIEMLKFLLPRYDGIPQRIYRGESLERWRKGRIGLCWSTKIETALMFARGLNAVRPLGGVLLCCHAPADAIIAALGGHSRWLQEHEYVVDPSSLKGIREERVFPASH